jgi:hypothetical protein
MRRTFVGIVLMLVATLALILPGKTVAGPPEGVSGEMVLDKVADGLLRYRLQTDPQKRRRWLKQLAPTKDPRVAVVLGEALAYADPDYLAAYLLCQYYLSRDNPPSPKWAAYLSAAEWWDANEADLRRRAKQLP